MNKKETIIVTILAVGLITIISLFVFDKFLFQ